MAFQLALLFTGIFVGTFAKTSVQTSPGISKPQCNVNNFYAGPHCCKKIEQQLTEIKEAIAALKTNQTGGSYDKGLQLHVYILDTVTSKTSVVYVFASVPSQKSIKLRSIALKHSLALYSIFLYAVHSTF